jgi:Protein of unknown function (DUF1524)
MTGQQRPPQPNQPRWQQPPSVAPPPPPPSAKKKLREWWRMIALGVVLAAMLWFYACGAILDVLGSDDTSTTTQDQQSTAPTPTPTPTALPRPPTDSVLYAAYQLKVGEPELDGYDRDEFGQKWADVDRNGCDLRNDVLRRDLRKRHTKPGTGGCVMLKGALRNDDHNYAGYQAKFERGDGEVEIDHVVSLHNAWEAGAHGWSAKKRQKLANDFMNLEAVDSGTNSTKDDLTVNDWLPDDETDACFFVGRVVAIKHKYELTVTELEQQVMVETLTSPTCDGSQVRPYVSSYFKVPKPKPMGEPKPKPKPTPTPKSEPKSEPSRPSVRRGVHPGAFCSPAGAVGATTKGTPMVCKGPGQPRWRAR